MQYKLHEACIVTSILFYKLFFFSVLCVSFFLSLLTLGLGWTFPVFLTFISSNFKGVSQ